MKGSRFGPLQHPSGPNRHIQGSTYPLICCRFFSLFEGKSVWAFAMFKWPKPTYTG
ncbi:hypothetical protein Lalb_Chr11g0071881 [Lupinus albus]|uniref:Uncharacterized protein n=1 Tax=Lupinus albus TaxID=3870 RepID=A0A6A4PSH8_LUPAL|nr:hypothetical protein Lalb_Chr11g0071881 [Lupinus albus]